MAGSDKAPERGALLVGARGMGVLWEGRLPGAPSGHLVPGRFASVQGGQ